MAALAVMLAGCSGSPAVSPAPLADLDRAAWRQGMLGSADYATARDILMRTPGDAAAAAYARLLAELRAAAVEEEGARQRGDTAALGQRALELDRAPAGVRP